jgi:hypothetical protein
MSERLVFELQAIDNATAPLRKVNSELERTGAATRKLAGQFDSTTVATRKFAMGALQQAGFQIGDFAVQVANGTNKMQAFGQQAPQILQIFGPIGAVVGAAVAIFAAFSVAVDKMSSSSNRAAEATESLKKKLLELNAVAAMSRFGVVSPEEAAILERIDELTSKIAETQIRLGEIKLSNSLEDRGRMQSVIAELNALEQQKAALSGVLDNYKKVTSINGQMLALQEGHYAALLEKLIPSEKERLAIAEDIHAQMIVIQSAQAEYIKSQDSFNNRLIQGYALYGNLRRQAQGLAADAAAAAQAAVDPQMFKTIGAYQLYAKTMLAAPTEAPKAKEEKSSGGGGGATDPMKTLREQLALESELLGKTEAQQRVIQALGLDYRKYGDEAFQSLVGQITKMDELNRLAEQQRAIASTIRESFSNAFMSMVDGTKSVKDAFREMARNIIMKLYEVLVVQQMVNGIMGFVGKAFPALSPFINTAAMGGPVTGGKPVLVGERGPELMVPSRNAQVIPNNQLGGGGVTIVQNINVSTGVQQTVRAEIKSLMPQIADSAKAAVLDAKRRGGSYGGAFA